MAQCRVRCCFFLNPCLVGIRGIGLSNVDCLGHPCPGCRLRRGRSKLPMDVAPSICGSSTIIAWDPAQALMAWSDVLFFLKRTSDYGKALSPKYGKLFDLQVSRRRPFPEKLISQAGPSRSSGFSMSGCRQTLSARSWS